MRYIYFLEAGEFADGHRLFQHRGYNHAFKARFQPEIVTTRFRVREYQAAFHLGKFRHPR